MAIANADGSIVLTTKVDQSGLKKGMSTMKSGVSSLIGSFGKLATAIGIAFSVGAIVKFSKEASNLATTTEASVQRLIDIYGSASQAVGDFIDANANALGMSKAAAASYTSVYGNLFSVWADQQTNAALTTQYLNMTAVVASKTGRTVEDVQERIRSGLLGNTEAIEDLGIFVNVKTIEMTDAFQRMADGKSWEQLDAYTQQQIRSMAILEQATAKYGDEVAQTTALTKSQFQAAWQDFQATWGQVVNRVLIPVLEILTDILVTSTAVMQSLFGISSSTISQGDKIEEATKNQDEFTKSVKKTDDATKKVLAGFDDLQILSSTPIGTSQDFVLPEINVEEKYNSQKFEKILGLVTDISQQIKELFEPFKKINFSKVKKSLSDLTQSFSKLANVSWDIISKAITDIIAPLADFYVEEVLPRYFDTLGIAIDGVVVILEEGWETLKRFYDEFLKPIIDFAAPTFLGMWDDLNADLEEFVNLIEESEVWEDFRTILSEIYKILEPTVAALVAFTGEIARFTLNQAFVDSKWIFKDLEDTIGSIADLIRGDFDGAWEHLEDLFVDNKIDKAKEKFEQFKKSIDDISSALFGIKFSEWWDEHVAPWFAAEKWKQLAKDAGNGIISGFEAAANGIITLFEKMINVVIGGFNKISISLPDWEILGNLAGKTYGVNISPATLNRVSFPRLAQGTVVPPNREFLAVLGDNKKENEIVSPISAMKQAFTEAMSEMGGVGQTTREEHYYLSETELMSIIYKLSKGGERLKGSSLISGGVY